MVRGFLLLAARADLKVGALVGEDLADVLEGRGVAGVGALEALDADVAGLEQVDDVGVLLLEHQLLVAALFVHDQDVHRQTSGRGGRVAARIGQV